MLLDYLKFLTQNNYLVKKAGYVKVAIKLLIET